MERPTVAENSDCKALTRVILFSPASMRLAVDYLKRPAVDKSCQVHEHELKRIHSRHVVHNARIGSINHRALRGWRRTYRWMYSTTRSMQRPDIQVAHRRSHSHGHTDSSYNRSPMELRLGICYFHVEMSWDIAALLTSLFLCIRQAMQHCSPHIMAIRINVATWLVIMSTMSIAADAMVNHSFCISPFDQGPTSASGRLASLLLTMLRAGRWLNSILIDSGKDLFVMSGAYACFCL
jgi:hypothetical protein